MIQWVPPRSPPPGGPPPWRISRGQEKPQRGPLVVSRGYSATSETGGQFNFNPLQVPIIATRVHVLGALDVACGKAKFLCLVLEPIIMMGVPAGVVVTLG